jgi:prolipoprotein diacylglyceryl transferase
VRELASIPSPSQSVWHVGVIPIRAYALCIVAGIFVALWLTSRRWRARGGSDADVWDVAGWAVVFGIIGGRLYHVVSDPELYFEKGEHPIDALKIWDGGLGIWGAIALGALGAWIGCRRKAIRLTAFADAAAPGIVAAQGIGRWGNWFNNELYGGPTSLPWRLEIHDIDVVTGHSQACEFGHVGAMVCGYYQPTFLYESIWDLALAGVLIFLSSRIRLGSGNVFALYVMGYTAGRGWIEALRHDHANHILGLRLNDWTSILVFLGGLIWFLRHRQRFDDRIYTARRLPPGEDPPDGGPPDATAPDAAPDLTDPTDPAGVSDSPRATGSDADTETDGDGDAPSAHEALAGNDAPLD